MPHYLQGDESAVAIIWAQALTERGTVRWRGTQCGTLVNDKGERIGSFHKYWNNSGWSVWTKPYAGYAYPQEVEVLPCPDGDTCEFANMHYTVSAPREEGPCPTP